MTFVSSGLCRVTVVAPHTRMDVALPAAVPLVELQAELLAQVAASPDGGYFINDGVAAGGWTLARIGGAPLDGDLSCAQLGISDGEELHFRSAQDTAPAAVFDDVVDAVATAAANRSGPWRRSSTRRFGLIAAMLALISAVVTAAAGADGLSAALVLTAGLAGLAAAWALDRAFQLPGPAILLGTAGIFCGLIGGGLVVADGRWITEYGAPQLLSAGCVAVAYALIANLAVSGPVPAFHAALVSGSALALGAGLRDWTGMTTAGAAATVAGLALLAIPMLPMISYRLARLPLPDIPTTPAELRADIDFADEQGEQLLARSNYSDEYFTGMLTACAGVIAVAVTVLALDSRLPALLLCVALSMLMLLKARNFTSVRLRLPMLVAGFVGPGALALTAALSMSGPLRLGVVSGGLAAVAIALLIYSLAVAGKKLSPVWGRTGDIAHILLAVSVIPLTLWVWGAYWWIRTI